MYYYYYIAINYINIIQITCMIIILLQVMHNYNIIYNNL